MDVKSIKKKINNNRNKIEAAFVFALWKNPELYGDYIKLNEGKDNTLIDTDACFYFNLGKAMYNQGYRNFDNITLSTFLENKPDIKKKYDEYGGYSEIQQLMSIISVDNIEANFDKICKMNSLSLVVEKYDKLFGNIEKFENSSNADVYNALDLINNSVALSTNHNSEVEKLNITDDFLAELNTGDEMGLSYSKYAPILNYTTLGCKQGELFMIGGHSGVGKSSFIFNNMIIPFTEQGIKCCVISNEMRSKTYKILLLAHVLTTDLNYWQLTRKKIKLGHYTETDWEYIRKAQEIINEKYQNIYFIKLQSDDTSVVMQHIKKMARLGCVAFAWDTMKSDDVMDESMWQSLLANSRKLYHLVDNLNVSMVVTYQLALHTQNRRWLDAECLANGKQVKEVFSDMVYMRVLWDDEYNGEKYDCKPYQRDKENKKIKNMITLDKTKKYIVCFVDKTRDDDDKKTILFQWDGAWNRWEEVGFCNIVNDHRGF